MVFALFLRLSLILLFLVRLPLIFFTVVKVSFSLLTDMACYHPLLAKYYPSVPGSSKHPVKVYSAHDLPQPHVDHITGELVEPFRIPCGRCIGCRLDYSRHWADRLVCEALDHSPSMCWFVTLTYDDDHLPDIGAAGVATLVPRDVTLFLKRLREFYSRVHGFDSIRFYLAGEYGSTTFRPHYHVLLFGLDFPDKVFYKANVDGDPLYSSAELDSVWSKGFCTIGSFTWHSAAYTARYVVKKLKGPDAKSLYESFGLVPEFVRMSRKPGIGFNYFSKHFDKILSSDRIQLPQGMSCSAPKYFLRLAEESDPLSVLRIREQRRAAMNRAQTELSRYTDLLYEDYLLVQEKYKKQSALSLCRKEF